MTNRQTIHDLLARLTEDRHEAEAGSLRRVIAEERARADRCTREAANLREMLDDVIESLELLAPVPDTTPSAVPSLHPAAIFDELATRGLYTHPDGAYLGVSAAWEALRAVLDRARDLEAAAARPVDLGVAGPDTPVMVDAGLVPDDDGWYPHDGTAFPACAPADQLETKWCDGTVMVRSADAVDWAHADRDDDIIAWRPVRPDGGDQ